MTIMVPQSGIPWIDPCGDPYAGAKAYFYLAGTTTPKTVYTGADKGLPHDSPVVANGSGMFPAIFVDGDDYRLRIETASGATIWDVDGISVPQITTGGGGGDTPVQFLFQTGDFKDRHGTGSHAGWVRANGQTIGAAASGATERANSDCQALFEYLWNADSTLAVSGGRGGNATSDWAANKRIALPDHRLRAAIGMASMGAAASTIIPASIFDGSENGDTLGATVGVGSVTLTVNEIPSHDHAATFSGTPVPPHTHGITVNNQVNSGSFVRATNSGGVESASSAPGGGHTPAGSVTVNNRGGGAAHINVQPSVVVTRYIKL